MTNTNTNTGPNSNQISTYALTGLHCGACIKRVTAALTPFAAGIEVSLQPMQVVLVNATASFDALRLAVESAGKYVLMPNEASNMPLAHINRAQAAPVIIAPGDIRDFAVAYSGYNLLAQRKRRNHATGSFMVTDKPDWLATFE